MILTSRYTTSTWRATKGSAYPCYDPLAFIRLIFTKCQTMQCNLLALTVKLEQEAFEGKCSYSVALNSCSDPGRLYPRRRNCFAGFFWAAASEQPRSAPHGGVQEPRLASTPAEDNQGQQSSLSHPCNLGVDPALLLTEKQRKVSPTSSIEIRWKQAFFPSMGIKITNYNTQS